MNNPDIINHIVWGFFLEGIMVIILGLLIFIYPALLGMIVGTGLIVTGLVSISIATRIKKISKSRS